MSTNPLDIVRAGDLRALTAHVKRDRGCIMGRFDKGTSLRWRLHPPATAVTVVLSRSRLCHDETDDNGLTARHFSQDKRCFIVLARRARWRWFRCANAFGALFFVFVFFCFLFFVFVFFFPFLFVQC